MNRPDHGWLFFDVGGPLVDDSAAVVQRREIDLRVLKEYLPDLTMDQIIALWPQACKELGSIDKNLVKLLLPSDQVEEAHQKIQKQKATAPSYLELLSVRTEAAAVCEKLAGRYKLGIIANQSPLVKEQLKEAGILQHFSHTKVSGDYGLEKPDPKLFQAVLDETGADPKRSAMIDDNTIRSLMPAKRFGMTTVWYQLEPSEDQTFVPDYTIQRLEDLLTLF